MRLSSRERLIKAFNCEKPDYVPCSFMLFNALRAWYDNDYDFFKKQMELGLDTVVYLPLIERKKGEITDFETLIGPPIRVHPDVKIKEWIDRNDPDENCPILHKEYTTPEGSLKAEVRRTSDWIFEDRLPILCDWMTPRSKKFLVQTKDDINKLKYVLTPPTKDDIKIFREKSEGARKFAKKHDLLIAGMWGLGVEAAAWLTGLEYIIMQTVDDSGFVEEFAEFIESWNRSRMEIFLEFGVDFFVRRGWYESVDFWSPNNFRKYVLPSLKREVKLCHQAGTRFAYTIVKGSLPLIDQIAGAKVDILIGVDPSSMDPYMDLKLLHEKVNGKMCLWGGINEAVTIQSGTEDEIREAVKKAINILGKDGGFILSPVENVLLTTDEAWKKVMMFIKIWNEMKKISTMPSDEKAGS